MSLPGYRFLFKQATALLGAGVTWAVHEMEDITSTKAALLLLVLSLLTLAVAYWTAEKIGKVVSGVLHVAISGLMFVLSGAFAYVAVAIGFQLARLHFSQEQIVQHAEQVDAFLVYCGFNVTEMAHGRSPLG
jgi:positive regulator of sigma E activity